MVLLWGRCELFGVQTAVAIAILAFEALGEEVHLCRALEG